MLTTTRQQIVIASINGNAVRAFRDADWLFSEAETNYVLKSNLSGGERAAARNVTKPRSYDEC